MKSTYNISIEKSIIENAINSTRSMGEASALLKLERRTFRKLADEYNLYDPIRKCAFNERYSTIDILNGLYPQYHSAKLSKRLVKEGFKEYKCESCGISEYNNKPISLELNHINGNSYDHSLDNLELL